MNDLVCGMLQIQVFIMDLCYYVFLRGIRIWDYLYVTKKKRNFNFIISSAFLIVTGWYQMSFSSLMD